MKKQKTGKIQKSPEIQAPVTESATDKRDYSIKYSNEIESVHPHFTITKPISVKDAVQLRRDFDRPLVKARTDSGYIKKHVETISDDKGRLISYFVTGFCYSFDYDLISSISIEQHTRINDDNDFTAYFISIVVRTNFLREKYEDGEDPLKYFEDFYNKTVSNISKLFGKLTSYQLKEIFYYENCITYKHLYDFEENDIKHLLSDLIRRSGIDGVFREWAMLTEFNKISDIDKRLVKIKFDSCHNYWMNFEIIRTFNRRYTLGELFKEDTTEKTLIVDALISRNFEQMDKAIAIYLKNAIMGGTYYSMENAIQVLADKDWYSSLGEGKLERLIRTLQFIEEKGSIYAAKMSLLYHDDDDELLRFINDLHTLVALDINPVTIPKRYELGSLRNPIDEYFDYFNNHPNSASLIVEMEEKLGPWIDHRLSALH